MADLCDILLGMLYCLLISHHFDVISFANIWDLIISFIGCALHLSDISRVGVNIHYVLSYTL